jgi:hypothetical protein
MTCCTPIIQTGNSALTDMQYTASMAQVFGPTPKIEVMYLNEEGNYVFAGVFTQVQFNGSQILVDHGGPAKWLLKIS